MTVLDERFHSSVSWNRFSSALQSLSSQEPKHRNRMFMDCHNRIDLLLFVVILGLAGCGGGFPNPGPSSTSVSVNPTSITVAAGSTTAFTALYAPSAPAGGSLTWSVLPATGGTITSAGVYTASGTSGAYNVVATWTPTSPAAGVTISGSATVEVLPVPQLGVQLNPNFIQASGANQASGSIQNGAVAGQLVPSVTVTDSSGNVQTRSGFTVPAPCTGSQINCP